MMNISERLTKLRGQRGLTLREVAEYVGVPTSTYRDWEYGKAIRIEPYVKLAELYEIGVEELLTGKCTTRREALHALSEAQTSLQTAIRVVQAL